jgi:hypothetical protein
MTIITVKFLLFFAMGATLVSLGLGMIGMFRKTKFYQAYSNRLMQFRILFQGMALLLFTLLFLMQR